MHLGLLDDTHAVARDDDNLIAANTAASSTSFLDTTLHSITNTNHQLHMNAQADTLFQHQQQSNKRLFSDPAVAQSLKSLEERYQQRLDSLNSYYEERLRTLGEVCDMCCLR